MQATIVQIIQKRITTLLSQKDLGMSLVGMLIGVTHLKGSLFLLSLIFAFNSKLPGQDLIILTHVDPDSDGILKLYFDLVIYPCCCS